MKIYRVLLLAAMLLMFAVPVLAQDASEPSLPRVDIEAGTDNIVVLVLTLITAVAASPLVTVIVSLLKRIDALKLVRTETLATIVSVVVTIAAVAAGFFGFADQFYAGADAVYTIIMSAMAFVGVLGGAAGTYNVAQRLNAPLIGYARKEGQ